MFFCLGILFFLLSCNKEEASILKGVGMSDYTNTLSQQRVRLGKTLVSAFSANSEMKDVVIKECFKFFDGDRNVLCKDLFNERIITSTKQFSTFGKQLEYFAINNSANFKLSSNIDNNSLIQKDTLVQIYLYLNELSLDSSEIDGVVVLPYPFNEKSDLLVLLIKNDGTESSIRTDIEPDANYLIVSQNERTPKDGNVIETISFKKSNSSLDEPNFSQGKAMSITNASFVSMNAKRSVESWAAGEPEVRVNIMYGVKNHVDHTMDPKNSTFYYLKNWVKTSWMSNTIRWVDTKVECPYWYANEHSFERRIRWTEEDGTAKEGEVSQVFTDPITNIKTTLKVTIPASTNETVIADSYIDFKNPSAGEQNWGLIKFILAF